jgi:hypothetical protein
MAQMESGATDMTERNDPERLRRKADQHWEMAGLARQDGDRADADRHTKEARRYEQLLKEQRT